MATSAVIAHQIPGRARLLVRDKRGDTGYFSDLSDSLGRFDGVQRTKTNPTTGSVTLEFIGDLQTLLKQAEDTDLLSITENVLPDGGPERGPAGRRESRPSSQVRPMGYPINLVSGRDVNRMFIVGSVLLVIGVIQTIRGEWFPPAVSVFWMAATAFRMAEAEQELLAT
ncbi:MAG: hypothetical protein V7642_2171 [Burkholderiales bacterium]|jgi:hypothetical protein